VIYLQKKGTLHYFSVHFDLSAILFTDGVEGLMAFVGVPFSLERHYEIEILVVN
jgi:hypothetical protein